MWKLPASVRVLLALAALFCMLMLPWWAPIIFMIVLSFFWRAWEVLVLGLFMDFLWLPHGGVPLFLIGAIVLVWAFEPIRKEFLME